MARSKDAVRAYNRAYRAKNRDRINASLRLWKKQNPDKVRGYSRQAYTKNPLRVRNIQLKRKFGIDLATYETMRDAQDNRCAVCHCDTPGGKGDWHVDHDHSTGHVRGLLCQNCNIGLGNFQDSPRFLAAAIKYLQKHKKQSKLKTHKESNE